MSEGMSVVLTPLVIVCDSWAYDRMGGAYKLATELALHCAAEGRPVHYVCAHGNVRAVMRSMEGKVCVWRYARPPRSGKSGSIGNYRGHMKGVSEAMSRVREKIHGSFVLNGHTHLQYHAAMKSCPANSIRHRVMSVHSPLVEEYLAGGHLQGTGLRGRLALSALRRVEADCYRFSDLIQCDSQFTLQMLQHAYPKETGDRMVITPGFVDKERFASVIGETRAAARVKLQGSAWQTESRIFFCLRRLVERMGLENLLHACAWLKKRMPVDKPGFKLILGGEGSLRPALEMLSYSLGLDSIVHFVGRVPEKEMPLAYRAADCFVLPTEMLECFGLVILESFAAGTPLLATPVGAIAEVLGPFSRDFLLPGSSPQEIGMGMLKFMNDPDAVPSEAELQEYAASFDSVRVLPELERLIIGGDAAAR